MLYTHLLSGSSWPQGIGVFGSFPSIHSVKRMPNDFCEWEFSSPLPHPLPIDNNHGDILRDFFCFVISMSICRVKLFFTCFKLC